MKIKIKLIAIAVLLTAGYGSAHADLSIEQSRQFNSGGQSQTIKTGVAPSDFDPNLIAYKLTMAGGGEMGQLWAATPEQPTAASWKAANQAVANGANLAGGAISSVGGTFLTSVTGWVAWGIQSGFIDPGYYSRLLASCITRESGNTDFQGLMYRRQSCQVSAYIQAYALNPRGYVGGNLMGLVPLCEVQQQNDCDITSGQFDPMAALKRNQAKAAQEQQALQSQMRWNAMSMHSQKFALYLALKHCKTERDAGKLDAKAYQKCVEGDR